MVEVLNNGGNIWVEYRPWNSSLIYSCNYNGGSWSGWVSSYLKEIVFDPSSGTIDLNTLRENCAYKFAGSVTVTNWITSTISDCTLLTMGGTDRGWQLLITQSSIYFRICAWEGSWLPWFVISGTQAS